MHVAFSALRLSANCVLALANAKLLDRDQELYLSAELKALAELLDETAGGEDLPAKTAVHLQSLAAILAAPPKP